jgi:hypothetical protein
VLEGAGWAVVGSQSSVISGHKEMDRRGGRQSEEYYSTNVLILQVPTADCSDYADGADGGKRKAQRVLEGERTLERERRERNAKGREKKPCRSTRVGAQG